MNEMPGRKRIPLQDEVTGGPRLWDAPAPGKNEAAVSRNGWRTARLAGGTAVLAVLVLRLGTAPFRSGLHSVDRSALAAAVGIGAVTTVCAAWRWRLVARGLGIAPSLPSATAAYYRAQFLNSALPGGVVGDVHRGLDHGRNVGDIGRGLRAVGWERAAGQAVQVVVAVLVLVALPSPVRRFMPDVLAAGAGLVIVAVVALRALPRGGDSRPARLARTVLLDIREGLLTRQAWPAIVVASLVVVGGHVATFVIAARTAASPATTAQLVPLAMLALLAMAVPTNIGGWGPREGVAAWAFGAAGLGGAQGVAAATVYGVLVFAACLPGAVVLVGAWLRGLGRERVVVSGPGSGGGSGRDCDDRVVESVARG
jgi:glycosyltransferase 2 family protein